MHADFSEDLRRWLRTTMLHLHWTLPARDDVQALGVAYFSGVLRRIAPAPRRVEWSTELRAKMAALSGDVVLGLQTVEVEALAGEDLNPRLNKWIKAASDPEKQDMLLADWGIYHLHLGRRVQGQEFTERSGPVLFVRGTVDTLYFVDVMLHGGHAPRPWEQDSLIEIVRRNWPHLLLPSRLLGGVVLSPDDRKQLRTNGIQALWQGPDGVNYYPYLGGYTSTRVPTRAVRDTIRLRHTVANVERMYRQEAEQIAQRVGHEVGRVLNELHLALEVDRDGTGDPFLMLVKETTTDLHIEIQPTNGCG